MSMRSEYPTVSSSRRTLPGIHPGRAKGLSVAHSDCLIRDRPVPEPESSGSSEVRLIDRGRAP